MRGRIFWTIFPIALIQGCNNDPELTCGTGTRAMGDTCVPISMLGCGGGTKELNGVCVPTDPLACGAGTQAIGGECVPISVTTCGPGTQEVNGECVPTTVIACGEGTENVNNECVPTALVGGHYQKQFIFREEAIGVGSHTDEVRLRDDDLLFNCSYTFNILDVSDGLDELTPVGSAALKPQVGTRRPGCKHLDWDGDLVYVTHPGNIRDGDSYVSGWDIAPTVATRSERTPALPVQLPVLQELGMTYQGVAAENGYIYVARRENGLGVYRHDVPTSTTVAPSIVPVGSLATGFTNAWGIVARGNTVFMTDLAEAFVTIDVTDPANPIELGRVALGGTSRFMVVEGDYAYVAGGSEGLYVIDVSNLANPIVLSQTDMPGTAVRLDYSDGRVVVAAWNDIRVYDVTNPVAPGFLAALRIPREYDYDNLDRELPTMRIFGVAMRGQDIFVGTWENPFHYWFEPDRVAPNLHLPDSAVRLDVGPVAAGQTGTIQIEARNQGTAPLVLTDVWMTGEGFTVSPRQALIAVGESVMLTVSFSSTSTEVESTAFLNIASDDPEYPLRKPYVVANAGGLAPGTPLPNTMALLTDGTVWNSNVDAAGDVLLLAYFATF